MSINGTHATVPQSSLAPDRRPSSAPRTISTDSTDQPSPRTATVVATFDSDRPDSNGPAPTSTALPPVGMSSTTNTSAAATSGLTSASSAPSQPKVNQSAFIHKLYNMLEDTSIQHLISWTSTNDSFVVSPNEEFSKVLSQYFKHTNVSSFVRQLNMYGFHKVNDVFHAGSTTDSGQWEFKHGEGIFKRGDVESLRGIKRRASRPSVVNRDSISSSKSGSVSMPVTPISPNGTGLSNNPSPGFIGDSAAGHAAALAAANAAAAAAASHRGSLGGESADAMRLATLENTMWQLQDSQLRLQARSDMVLESVRTCQEWLRSLISIVLRLPFGNDLASVEAELRRLHDEVSRRSRQLVDESMTPYSQHLKVDSTATGDISPHQRDDRANGGRNSVFRPQYPSPLEGMALGSGVLSQQNVTSAAQSHHVPILSQSYGPTMPFNPPLLRARPGSYPSASHANSQQPSPRRHTSGDGRLDPSGRTWSDVSSSTDSSGDASSIHSQRRSFPSAIYNTEHTVFSGERLAIPTQLLGAHSQVSSPLSPSPASLSPLHQPLQGVTSMRRESINPAVQFSSVNQHYRLHPGSPKMSPTSAPSTGSAAGPPPPPSGLSQPLQPAPPTQVQPQISTPQQQPTQPQQPPTSAPPVTASVPASNSISATRQSVAVGVYSLLNPLDKEDRADESPPLSPLSTGRKRRKEM
ncbi:HSF-type DNA-binding-domain-containing protein [Lipomyces tetrasporus]|uniref:HSF-type DNA-binding-domain-containing protein n=1 Tax=Lipomyces tetrasporus TaxID=54092 RepID=A0AAD7VUL1_9ASCO|nr:HSF-type DNA-binding-domain-containing protein [Lipomyces tetrasporus]KAJ8101365.1 HSF-type DNA-binding-domain-containing protein [Lipomyces tetrasporus]